jgi:hypothetical protein
MSTSSTSTEKDPSKALNWPTAVRSPATDPNRSGPPCRTHMAKITPTLAARKRSGCHHEIGEVMGRRSGGSGGGIPRAGPAAAVGGVPGVGREETLSVGTFKSQSSGYRCESDEGRMRAR